ncbi:MAG: hypothetical protein R3217_01140 [Gammaproteobacteria bacterium]|nr:hypothetical protein [Gammaproteobacteria bacterium]
MHTSQDFPVVPHAEKVRRWKYVALSLNHRCRSCHNLVVFDERQHYFTTGNCQRCTRQPY